MNKKFYNLNVISFLTLFVIVLFTACQKEESTQPEPPVVLKELSINNDIITLKVDLSRGGAINYLSHKGKQNGFNLVNIADEGRYIQQSYYAGNSVNRVAEGQSPDWSPWTWNPIQVGDYARNRAQILDYKQEGNSIYTKCTPMLWDMDNEAADAVMEQWTAIEGNVIEVKNRFTINSIPEVYGEVFPRDQELPAVYPISALSNLYSYTGETPFENDDLENLEVVNLSSGFWGIYDGISGRETITEKWMAFVDYEKFGLGVYTPIADKFIAGMAGEKGRYDTSGSTSYIAPLKIIAFKEGDVFEYKYYLVVGDLETIRKEIYLLEKEIGIK